MISICVSVMILISRDCLCIDISSEKQSINEAEEKNILNEGKNLYYLPQQTVFRQPGFLREVDASKTSPPSIIIKPSTTLQTKESHPPTKDFSGGVTKGYSSFCTSESRDALNSEELLPSRDISKESLVLSGYMETPSKTSDDHHHQMPEVSRLVSISSDDKILIGSAL